MKKTLTPLILLAIAAFGVQLPSHAAVVVAEADTFVDSNTPDTNYGSNSQLWMANDARGVPTTVDRWTILRFDLSSLPDQGASATITLTTAIANRPGDYEVYGVADLGADELFDESTYTFNTSAYSTNDRDEDGGINLNDNSLLRSSLTLLGTFSSSAAQYSQASFSSPELLSFLNADTNDKATFIISTTTPTGSSTRRFYSSNDSTMDYRPQLDISVPEPGSMSMLAIGGILATLFRRSTKRT